MLVGLAQLNSVIGDLDGNKEKMLAFAEAAVGGGFPLAIGLTVQRALK